MSFTEKCISQVAAPTAIAFTKATLPADRKIPVASFFTFATGCFPADTALTCSINNGGANVVSANLKTPTANWLAN